MKPAVSADGTFLAAVGSAPSSFQHSLYVYAGTQRVLLSQELDVRGPSPVFAPDGRRLLFSARRQGETGAGFPDLWEVSVLGGAPRLVATFAWAGDYHPRGEGYVLSVIRGNTPSSVLRDGQGREDLLVERGFWPRWSPDGTWIAYTTSNPEGGPSAIWVISPDGQHHRQLSREFSQVYGLAWTYRPQGVVCGASSGDGLPFQLYWLSVHGKTVRPLTLGTGDYVAPTVFKEDTIFFSAGREKAAFFVADWENRHFVGDVFTARLFDACFVQGTARTVWLQRQNAIPKLCFKLQALKRPRARPFRVHFASSQRGKPVPWWPVKTEGRCGWNQWT